MNENQKNILYFIAEISLIIFAVVSLVWTFKVPAIPIQNTESKKIEVFAEGKISVKPDIVVINAGVETRAKTSEEVQSENDAKMTKIINFLKSQGVEEKNIKTSNYSLYPEYYYPQNQKPVLTGFILNQTVEIKIIDFKKMSAIIGGLTKNGVNVINNINFQIDEPEKYQSEARTKAIEKAKTEAEKIAKNLGVKLGKVIKYNETASGYQPYPVYYKSAAEGMGGGGSPIEAGSQDVRVNVNVIFEIK